MLPEIASLIAGQMRYIFGHTPEWYARVILPDQSAAFERAHIVVGTDFLFTEAELFYLFPPDEGCTDWTLCQVVEYPGSRFEPPSSDFRDLLVSRWLPAILNKMVEVALQDKLAVAIQTFHYDTDTILYGSPAHDLGE